MIFTGERYLTEIGGFIRAEHLHRYRLACTLAEGKDVLDVACGEGYGTDLLAKVARSVTGVDVSSEAIEHAIARYHRPQLRFLVGDCAALPCEDMSFDLVVSFETIEHHERHEEMMREIRRVLRPGGVLMISSPNRPEYDRTLTEPNLYHVKELDFEEFATLLRAHFPNVAFYGQRVLGGSLIVPISERGGEFRYFSDDAEAAELSNPIYFVALASDGPLPGLGVSLQALEEIPVSVSASPAMTEARLYISEYMDGQTTPYGENRGAACQYAVSGERMTLTLALPQDVHPIARLRFDPASMPAALSLHRLTLTDAAGVELWRWQGNEADFRNLYGAILVRATAGPYLVCFNDDPQFELALPDAMLRQLGPGAGLRLEMTPRPILDALPEILVPTQGQPLLPMTPQAALPVPLSKELVELGQVMKAVIERRNATIATQKAELEALRESQKALEIHVQRAEAQLEVLKEFVLQAFGKTNERI